MKEPEEHHVLLYRLGRASQALTQGSRATGWDLWIYHYTTCRGVTLSASPERHRHHRLPQQLNPQRSALRLRRMILTINQQPQPRLRCPRHVRVNTTTPRKSRECWTGQSGAKACCVERQSAEQRTGDHASIHGMETGDGHEMKFGYVVRKFYFE